ncbi:MAG TPA: alkaline phosphatase family protein [Solirubrobacterales bacterium]|nr:alkaline phosphatase family protein [Solirubrobacterales bacterium]
MSSIEGWDDSEEGLRRREFLQRAAVTAGLGAGLAGVLSPDTILAEVSKRSRVNVPSPRNLPLDTIVVLMMENRSFDHYLGWLPNADGRQGGLSYADAAGNQHGTHRLTGDFQGCAHPDPDHSWLGGRQQLDGGRMDGFLRSGENDAFSIGYYAEQDLPFIPAVARSFTTFDRFFCSLLASTYPNREYMHAAQSYGMIDNTLPLSPTGLGFPDTTIFAALAAAGVSNRYFYTDIPVSALWGAPGLARSGQVQEYYERCATGTLPAVSFVDPAFNGEEQGTSGDEHPHGDVRLGQAFMADVVHAFLESPQFKRGALFIVYDEWGGFFDHVRPPRVPDDRANADVNQDFGQMGIRIPAVLVSPYARRGHVDHNIYGFESILKLIRYRFGLPPLTLRDKYARNIARSFDFEAKPNYEVPHLPDPPQIVSQACGAGAPPAGLGGQALAGRPKEHDLATLHTSGYLERLGFRYRAATPGRTFRHPSKLGLKP